MVLLSRLRSSTSTPTVISSGRLCSSALSLGLITPTARQMAPSSRWAMSIAVWLGLRRLSRAQTLRPFIGPSSTSNVNCRNSPVPALVGFISDAVAITTYWPSGNAENSCCSGTAEASKPARFAMLISFDQWQLVERNSIQRAAEGAFMASASAAAKADHESGTSGTP